MSTERRKDLKAPFLSDMIRYRNAAEICGHDDTFIMKSMHTHTPVPKRSVIISPWILDDNEQLKPGNSKQGYK